MSEPLKKSETQMSRRSFITKSATVIPAAALAGAGALPALASSPSGTSLPDTGVSPRLAELKAEFDATAAQEAAASAAADTLLNSGAEVPKAVWEEWEDLAGTLNDIAFEIMGEPVNSLADLRAKLAVWDRVSTVDEKDDDMTEWGGWMDRGAARLLSDTRQLLTPSLA